MSLVEEAKKLAAYEAVDKNFPDNAKVVGIGSGSTVVYVVDRIAQRKDAKNIVYVPTGFQSKGLILSHGLPLGSIDSYPELDIAFDGADEVDTDLNCIKGGGACLFQEKLVAISAKKFIIVADYRKKSDKLCRKWIQGVPVEVFPLAYPKIMRDLKKLGSTSTVLRLAGLSKAGPVVTDNGMFIIDALFKPINDPKTLASKIKSLIGVFDVGIFPNMACRAYFGNEDGTISVLENKNASLTDIN